MKRQTHTGHFALVSCHDQPGPFRDFPVHKSASPFPVCPGFFCGTRMLRWRFGLKAPSFPDGKTLPASTSSDTLLCQHLAAESCPDCRPV
jgi:hypothetical protein